MVRTDEKQVNIMVVGDIVVDHTIFAVDRAYAHGSEEGTTVVRRVNTVGGAANAARFLSIFNPGRTYLVGFEGPTMWGSVRDLFKESKVYDGHTRDIDMRLVSAEGDSTIDTINRLVRVSSRQELPQGKRDRRWEDLGNLTIPDYKRNALYDLIEQAHRDSGGLGGIILSDLDRGVLVEPFVKKVAELTQREGIALVVDPKRQGGRYCGIPGLAFLPNLEEWCRLVDEEKLLEDYRTNLDNPEMLKKMAKKTVDAFPHFQYYVITCDEQGAVLMISDSLPDLEIYRIPALSGQSAGVVKLGAGDVFTAMFLLKYLQFAGGKDVAIEACAHASAASAAHLSTEWHRFPSHREVEKAKASAREQPRKATSLPGNRVRLVRGCIRKEGDRINLKDAQTRAAGLMSVDPTYREKIKQMAIRVDEFRENVKAGGRKRLPKPMLILLGGPPRNGKTVAIEALVGFEATAKDPVFLKGRSVEEISEKLKARTGEFILIDEAVKDDYWPAIRGCVGQIQNWSKQFKVCFIFVSQEFRERSELHSRTWKKYEELYGRCHCFFLSPLNERLNDIPYILAAGVQSRHGGSFFELPWAVISEAIEEIHAKRGTTSDLSKYIDRLVNDVESSSRGGQSEPPAEDRIPVFVEQ